MPARYYTVGIVGVRLKIQYGKCWTDLAFHKQRTLYYFFKIFKISILSHSTPY